MQNIICNKIREDARIPMGRLEDVGRDIYCFFQEEDTKMELLIPGDSIVLGTGLRTNFDSNYYLQIANKSSVGSKGLIVAGGVIDSGYTGEIKVPLFNISNKFILIIDDAKITVEELELIEEDFYDCYPNGEIFLLRSKGLVQGILYPVPQVEWLEVSDEEYEDKTSHCERGIGGFGSTDKK